MCNAEQNATLALLVRWAGSPHSATELAELLGYKRKPLINVLGKLMQRKLVKRANKRAAFDDRSEPLYVATDAGVAFHKSGERITSGGKGRPKPKRALANSFRQRLWNAFRIQKKATLPELIEVAREKGDRESVEHNARLFLKALIHAGVVAKLPTREKGYAPTSNGFLRYALLRDLGPVAPIAAKAHLVNLNTATDAEKFLPYKENI